MTAMLFKEEGHHIWWLQLRSNPTPPAKQSLTRDLRKRSLYWEIYIRMDGFPKIWRNTVGLLERSYHRTILTSLQTIGQYFHIPQDAFLLPRPNLHPSFRCQHCSG